MRRKRMTMVIVILVLLYVGLYAALRATGCYQWRHIGVTRNYGPNDPRLIGVNEYDLITQIRSGLGVVHTIKPLFTPLIEVEYRMFVKGRPNTASHGTALPRRP